MMQCLVHPLCLFLLVWGGAAVLYVGGVYQGMFPSPGALTVAAVLLNVLTFTLGYLTWVLFQGLHPAPSAPAPVSKRPFTPHAAARALNFTLVMGAAALGLEVYRIVMIARHFGTTWLDLVTHPELFRIQLVTYIQQTLFQTSGTVMLLSITSSLFSLGFVLLGVFLHVDRTKRKYFYLAAFLAVALTIGLIHLSRYEVTSNILFLLFAYFFVSSADRSEHESSGRRSAPGAHRKSIVKLAFPVAAIVLLFVLIDVLLRKSDDYGLPNRLQGLLFHFYWYAAAPLATFNEFVTRFADDHQWGQSMFLPLYKWLCRFHLAQEVEVNYYGEKVLIPYLSNVYTYLRNFYEDFGLPGVAVVPYLLGWATAAVRVHARRHFQFLNLYLVLLLFIFFSFYNYFLASNQIYLQVFFGFVLFRYGLPGGGETGGSPAEVSREGASVP